MGVDTAEQEASPPMWAWYPFGAVGVLEIVCVEENAHDAVEHIGNVFHIVPK